MTRQEILIRVAWVWAIAGGAVRADWEPQWRPGDAVQGVDGTVMATTLWDPDGGGPQPTSVVIGGSFSLAGRVSAGNIACWNPATQSWTALGSGVDSWVYALAVLDGKLYAGGYFTTAGGATAHGVACWDPSTQTWSALGGGLATSTPPTPASVTALATLGGKVYVAGSFITAGGVSASNIACWDPVTSSWSALATGLTGTVPFFTHAMTGLGGKLYVGGDFTTAGGMAVGRIACWDPAASSWSALGTGVGGVEYPAVYDLAVMEEALFVAGDFATAGSETAANFAVWEPGAQIWISVGSTQTPIRALAADVDRIYAMHVPPKGEIAVWDLATWTWSDLTPAQTGSVSYHAAALALLDGRLYVGGDFRRAGGESARGIAAFDLTAEAWSSLVPQNEQIDGAVLAVTALDERVYVAGEFCQIGGTVASKIAGLDPDSSTWFELGTGLNDTALALAGLNGRVYAGGRFTDAGGVVVGRIACWDTAAQSWSALAGGVAGPLPEVAALAVLGDRVCAGGSFTSAGGQAAENIACWDPGASLWSPLGAGVDGRVNALVALDGKLYAGGYFATAGGQSISGVACWDPAAQTWSALGSGLGVENIYVLPFVRTMTALNGKLYVAGDFTAAGGSGALRIACWDPVSASWSALESGISEDVHTLAGLGGNLYVGGWFSLAGGIAASNLAAWNPLTHAWSSAGMGMDESVETLAAFDGTLYAGGYFAIAGNEVSPWFARSQRYCSSRPADLDHDCDVDLDDLSIFTGCLSGPDVPYDPVHPGDGCELSPEQPGLILADLDQDGDVDLDDFGILQRSYD